jgi:hypothetical protein
MDHLTELDLKKVIDYKPDIGSYERTKPWLDKMNAAAAAFDKAYNRHIETQNEAK